MSSAQNPNGWKQGRPSPRDNQPMPGDTGGTNGLFIKARLLAATRPRKFTEQGRVDDRSKESVVAFNRLYRSGSAVELSTFSADR